MSTLAQQLIAESLRTQNSYLDLGNCGLEGTEACLAQLARCTHLETLIFSNSWYEFDEVQQAWVDRKSQNKGEKNLLVQLPARLPTTLQKLYAGANVFGKAWQIQDLQALRGLKQLTSLDLSGNQIDNLQALRDLKQLTSLYLSHNQINNLQALQDLKQLTNLDLSHNQINNLQALQDLKQLTSLDLRKNQISNLQALRGLKQLTSLFLSDNQINNLQALRDLKQLTNLDLSHNQINNLQALQDLKQLTSLDLSDNQINNLQALQDLKQLTSLYLSGNQINNLQALRGLKQLTNLVLSGNQINNLQALQDLKQLTNLDLSHNQINNLQALRDLKQLTSLDLSDNQINNLQALRDLKQLTSLYLSHNQINNLQALQDLKQLTSLYLSYNQINNLQALQDLKQLTNLDLSHNQINNLQALQDLKQLTSLYLSHNQINNLQALQDLKQLTSLYLSHNQINNLQALQDLKQLTNLDLSHNQINNLQALRDLKQLTNLDLSHNQINNLQALQDLKQLTSLDLSDNQINNLQALRGLKQLTMLVLSDNQITYIPIDFLDEMNHLHFLYLEKNPVHNIPTEMLNRGVNTIRNHLQSVAKAEDQYALNEAKVIFVGVGEVGKSELAEALSEANYRFKEGRASTSGIRIKPWILPDCTKGRKNFELTAHIWDFAGQEINYGTHQFFLTKNSVYLFLWDARKEESQSRFNYWLQVIALLSDRSPVFVVQNKLDLYQREVDQQNWKQTFPNIVDFRKTSCKNGTGIRELRAAVKEELQKLPHIGEIWNKHRVAARKMLEAQQANYINYCDYLKICAQCGVNSQDARYLSRQLHDIGVILYFEHDLALQDTVVLRPEWATKAAYCLLDNEKEDSKIKAGRFHRSLLPQLWQDSAFAGKYPFLLRLMEHFELVFQLHDSEAYIIPELLPINAPAKALQFPFALALPAKRLCFEYHYEFMPRGVLSRFICRIHEHIYQQLFWKYGTILVYENTFAQVLWDNTTVIKTIKIVVMGAEADKLLFLIRNELGHIHKKLNDPPLAEKVPCFCTVCQSGVPYLYNYDTLQRYQQQNRPTIVCDESLKDVSVKALLQGILDGVDPVTQRLLDMINQYQVADFFNYLEHLKVEDYQMGKLREEFIDGNDGFRLAERLKVWVVDYFKRRANRI